MIEILNLLKKIEISEDAIKIYTSCLGKSPLTYNELFSLVSDMPFEDFKDIIDELVQNDLIIQIHPKAGLIMHYLAIPPIKSLLSFYSNYAAQAKLVPDTISDLLIKSLNKTFKEDEAIEFNSISERFQEFFKDFVESAFIEKQDVEEIMEEFEQVKEIKENVLEIKKALSPLPQKLMNAVAPQFKSLADDLKESNKKIIAIVKTLELKKKENRVINLFETLLKEQLPLIENLTSEVEESVKKEINEVEEKTKNSIIEPIENKIEETLLIGNDFKLLYLNVISNYEIKLKEFQKKLLEKKENFKKNLEKTLTLISENSIEIVKNSTKELLVFGEIIENLLEKFDIKEIYSKNISIDDLWLVNSKSKVLEEINNIIMNSKNDLVIIIPKIEKYLNIISLQNLPKSLSIRIASSDPYTNSLVKEFQEIENLEFRTINRDDFFGVKGDDNQILICLEKEDSEDPLNDLVGIGSNFNPIVNILKQIIEANWIAAQAKNVPTVKTIPPIQISPVKIPPPQKIPRQTEIDVASETSKLEPAINTEQTQGGYVSQVYPKAGDRLGMEINTAFNLVIQKLNTITGTDLSNELQKISDFILEKRGFSVTLHKLRNLINKYKNQLSPIISQNDKNQLFEELEEIKIRLLK